MEFSHQERGKKVPSFQKRKWKSWNTKDWTVFILSVCSFICHCGPPAHGSSCVTFTITPLLSLAGLLRLQMHFSAPILSSTDCDGQSGQLPDEISRHISQWQAGVPVSNWLHLNCVQRAQWDKWDHTCWWYTSHGQLKNVYYLWCSTSLDCTHRLKCTFWKILTV